MSTATDKPLNIRVHLPGNAVRVFAGDDFEARSEEGVKHEAIGRYNKMLGIISVGPDHTGAAPQHSVAQTAEPVTIIPPPPRSNFDEKIKAEAEAIQDSAMVKLGQQIGLGIKEAMAELKTTPGPATLSKEELDRLVDAEIARRANTCRAAAPQAQQPKR
jgi:hypothetical protein